MIFISTNAALLPSNRQNKTAAQVTLSRGSVNFSFYALTEHYCTVVLSVTVAAR